MNILLTIAYDGSAYAGWQFQNNAVTVQEKIEEALKKLYKTDISVMGASRTDTGVHAMGQRALYEGKDNIPLSNIPSALNSILPEDIRIYKAEEAAEDFHPIFDAKNKTYRYVMQNGAVKNPLLRNYSWYVPYALNLDKMKKAASRMIGEHDFACFCASGGSAKTTVRKINSIELYKEGELITFFINGNGFLYNMVRIIAGTLMYAGCGKIDENAIKGIILSKDRTKAGITAPPQGLTLMEVYYN
ncbi:tRNA pseudouridine(38-40) synthase TruA [Anaeropeptidivorans aminofermentans]|uniref:tRNA pseudouridine(38-40) synthase TruA n=1 Tax=Anaeropeptidivorans aminofermentans TaxID=2934315 RepID=UPI002025A881|nr:tRNA pseudouridine(38-40) synthase TruA [Anaeropeptidivorans aminofermentans]